MGKGITFDTGGLSIKPAEGMLTMKRDMTGGGVVIATMAALAAVGCPIPVTGLIPAAENSIDGNAIRPGDVLRQFSGRTTEVTNTDAEGRLVLADALAYAVAELAPAALVDIATLTGAMKIALGQRTGGYFANDESLAAHIEEAGNASGERLWRFPLVADYEDKLASKVADADNAPGGAGAITAALFLQHFVGDVPWAAPRHRLCRRFAHRVPRVDHRADRIRCPCPALMVGTGRPVGGPGMSRPLIGLTVRWSLEGTSTETLSQLTAYVAETSHARFTDMPGLAYKTWRARDGEWFEGSYVFETDAARSAFQDTFERDAPSAPGSLIIGSPPILIEACYVVAIAEGAGGFHTSSRNPGG